MNASVSVVPFPTAARSTSAHEALAQLVAGREELERFLEDVFRQLEKLWSQLEERQQTLVAERLRLDEQVREHAAEMERQRAAVDGPQSPTRDQVRQEVTEATASLAEAMVHQRRQMDEERARWREELTRMRQLLELIAGGRVKE
jgi:glycerol-3-phosphate O-acyltransferase